VGKAGLDNVRCLEDLGVDRVLVGAANFCRDPTGDPAPVGRKWCSARAEISPVSSDAADRIGLYIQYRDGNRRVGNVFFAGTAAAVL
jgi:hypothetical protein